MAAIYGSVRVPLRPNATYKARFATWEPLTTTWDDLMGVLIVEESRAVEGRKVYTSRYLIRRYDTGCFEVRKPLNAGGGEGPYHVEFGSHWDTCTCQGALAGKECKHVEALRALYRSGHLRPGKAPTTAKI
jgi:hypothetical protein